MHAQYYQYNGNIGYASNGIAKNDNSLMQPLFAQYRYDQAYRITHASYHQAALVGSRYSVQHANHTWLGAVDNGG